MATAISTPDDQLSIMTSPDCIAEMRTASNKLLVSNPSKQLATYTSVELLRSKRDVFCVDDVMYVVERGGDAQQGEMCEAEFEVIGMLAGFMFPSNRHLTRDGVRPQTLVQRAQIVSKDCEIFTSALHAIPVIHSFMDMHLPQGELLPLTQKTLWGLEVLTASTPLLTPRRENNQFDEVPMPTIFDPTGSVQAQLRRRGTYMYSQDNVIQVLQIPVLFDENIKGINSDYSNVLELGWDLLRPGHLVKMAMSFRAVKHRGRDPNRKRFIIVLRSLTLLSRTGAWIAARVKTETEQQAQESVPSSSTKTSVSLKRKFQEVSSVEDVTVAKFARMELDDAQ